MTLQEDIARAFFREELRRMKPDKFNTPERLEVALNERWADCDQQPYLDSAESLIKAYQHGWNDRESDIIERAERIAPQPEALGVLDRLLTHSGARGTYDAMKHGDAVKEAEALLASSPAAPARTPMGEEAAKREEVARIVELAIVRHGIEETALEGTLLDADAIIKALAAPPSVQPVEGK